MPDLTPEEFAKFEQTCEKISELEKTVEDDNFESLSELCVLKLIKNIFDLKMYTNPNVLRQLKVERKLLKASFFGMEQYIISRDQKAAEKAIVENAKKEFKEAAEELATNCCNEATNIKVAGGTN